MFGLMSDFYYIDPALIKPHVYLFIYLFIYKASFSSVI